MAKRTIRRLADELERNELETAMAFQNVRSLVAALVRSGKTDSAKLRASQISLNMARDNHEPKEIEILTELHAVLDAPLRTGLTAALRATQSARSEDGPRVWRTADATDNAHVAPALDWVTRELELTDQQQRAVSLLWAPPARTPKDGAQGRMQAILDAFELDTFDERTAAAGGPAAPNDEADDVVSFSHLLPILTRSQCNQMAATIEREDAWRPHEDTHDRLVARLP